MTRATYTSRYVRAYDHGYALSAAETAHKGDVFDKAHALAVENEYVKGSTGYNAFYNGYVNGYTDRLTGKGR